jgi:hypothetical protein
MKGFGKKAVSSISKYHHDTRMRWMRNTTKNSSRIVGGQAATKPRPLLSAKSKSYHDYIGQMKSSMAIGRLILFSKKFYFKYFSLQETIKTSLRRDQKHAQLFIDTHHVRCCCQTEGEHVGNFLRHFSITKFYGHGFRGSGVVTDRQIDRHDKLTGALLTNSP